MKHCKKGYILIELMVYSVLLVLLVLLIMSYATQSHLQINKEIEEASVYAHMSATLDRFMHDISRACMDTPVWKLATDKAHIWHAGSCDIGWENTPKGLVRSQGMYDSSTASWITRDKSFFQQKLRYSMVMLGTSAVKVTLVRNQVRMSRIMALPGKACL